MPTSSQAGTVRYTATRQQPAQCTAAVVSARILLAEDDAAFRDLLAAVLRKAGYQVTAAADGQQLLDQVSAGLASSELERSVDLVIADVKMPGWTGMDVLKLMRAAHTSTPVILITAFGDAALHRAAYELGAWVLDKPFDLEDFEEAVAALLRRTQRPDRYSTSSDC